MHWRHCFSETRITRNSDIDFPCGSLAFSLASAVKALYDLRSRIAHGETIESMKTADASRLARTMHQTPRILRAAIGFFLDGKGPEGTGPALTDWWSSVELG